ncbi:MAG: GGDEF domain-containing protein [Erythrobacter sp.]|nr:GGDEF domain-containing protein [Erythrobacter sp.]
MQTRMSLAEGAALHGLLEEVTGDIVVRVDRQGFIENASSNIAEIGYDLSQLLLKPHLIDLAEPEHSSDLKTRVDAVLSGAADENGSVDWFEFPVGAIRYGEPEEAAVLPTWYALSLRALTDDDGAVSGAIGLLRSVERKRALEGEVHTRALIDPLTGLANRHAFCASLRRQLVNAHDGAIALFEIDRMRAVFMQYGQRTADEIIWGFAKFLETMVGEDYELAQFDGERFCVILAGLSRQASRSWAEDVLKTFASLTLTTSARSPRLSASAGLARVEGSVDLTLRQAELALVMARARGGMQVAECVNPGQGMARIAL